jgi:hypothetical protein
VPISVGHEPVPHAHEMGLVSDRRTALRQRDHMHSGERQDMHSRERDHMHSGSGTICDSAHIVGQAHCTQGAGPLHTPWRTAQRSATALLLASCSRLSSDQDHAAAGRGLCCLGIMPGLCRFFQCLAHQILSFIGCVKDHLRRAPINQNGFTSLLYLV